MSTGLFSQALKLENTGRPPVWLMRQAGRYHAHYQALRAKHSFIDLCKRPELACEVTMGPIRDFDFDAAILFSDLLFPLEAMGMGLRYEPGPKLDWYLRSRGDLDRLKGGAGLLPELEFQAQALKRIRAELPPKKGLIGFVGGPLTLFFYAVAGSHQGDLTDARAALSDGRFEGFCERLLELLAGNLILQARAGAEVIAVMDTCAGEIPVSQFQSRVMPALRAVLERFQAACPGVPVLYYSKGTGPEVWRLARELPAVAGLGVDWRHPIQEVLGEFGAEGVVQGNFDPHLLFEEPSRLEVLLREFFRSAKQVPLEKRRGWVCGLGHGVMPGTPEAAVRAFMRIQREELGA
jgi:uroporphyrinogen decarboxylase